MHMDRSQLISRGTVVSYRITPVIAALPVEFEAECRGYGVSQDEGVTQFIQYVLHEYLNFEVEGFDHFQPLSRSDLFRRQERAIQALWRVLQFPQLPTHSNWVIVRRIGDTLWVSYLDLYWK